jgi:ABC-type nitrate/sulfonate/bicarbonate transport system permease component
VLFFGIGSSSKIAFAALYAFFPIAIQTLKGLRHVDPALIRTAVSLGASRRQLLFKVRLPAAFPVILAGVRLGAVLGLLTVVAGEMLGALAGIGQALSSAVQTFESAEAFAWILLVVALVSFVNSGLSWLERRVAGEP